MKTTEEYKFTPINEIGEFGLIDRLKEIVPPQPDQADLAQGIGDDAAVYRVGEGRVHVVTTDVLIERVHFDRTFVSMQHLGFKAISVNVSDVVAMNAYPRYALAAVGVPQNTSVEMMESLYSGIKSACDRYGISLIGGDTSAAGQLIVSVTAIGEADEDAVVYRRGAKPGDLLCVTGDIGSAYAGLKVLLDEKKAFEQYGDRFQPDLEPYSYVIQRQLTPVARLDVIKEWHERQVRPAALIDLSDGLASEVHHLCAHSACGAVVRAAALPFDLEARAVADRFAEDVDAYGLFGGEDYELVFALDPNLQDKLDATTFNVIGTFTPKEDGIRIEMEGERTVTLNPSGFKHF